MTYAEPGFMGRESQVGSTERPRERLKRFLRARLEGPFKAKQLQSILQCSPKHAENLLLGHWPADDRTLAAIVRHFGQDLLDAVFRPDIDATIIRLTQEERALDQALQAARLRRLQVEGRSFGDRQPHQETEAEGQLSFIDVLERGGRP